MKWRKTSFSKQLVRDIRGLLWIVTVGGLVLAGYCIHRGYTGSLPWLTAMVGLPWTAHGAVCVAYLAACQEYRWECRLPVRVHR